MYKRQHVIILGIICLTLTLLMQFYFNPKDSEDLGTYFLISSTVIIMIFIFFIFFDLKMTRTFRPIQFYFLGNIFQLGIGGNVMAEALQMPDRGWRMLQTSGHYPIAYLYSGYMMMLTFSLLLIVGYYLGERMKNNQHFLKIHSSFIYPSDKMVYGCFALYVIVSILPFGLGVLGSVLAFLGFACSYVYTLRVLQSKSRERVKYGCLLVIFVLVQFFFARQSLMRQETLMVFIPVFFAMVYVIAFNPLGTALVKRFLKGKRLLLILLIGAGVYFMGVIFFPALTDVKFGEAKSLQEAVSQRIFSSSDIEERVIDAEDDDRDFGIRQALVIVGGAICYSFRDRGYEIEHDPLHIFIAAFVPRFIWKGKPIIERGGFFNQYMLDLLGYYEQSARTHTSMAMTSPGELLWGYGYGVMMLMAFIMGYILGKLMPFIFSRDLRNLLASSALMICIMQFIKCFSAGFGSQFGIVLLGMLIAILFQMLFMRARKTS